VFKGGILHTWGKKMAVVVHRGFFDQLPSLQEVDKREAEIAWLIYDLEYDATAGRYKLQSSDVKHTKFEDALNTITTPTVGDVNDFIQYLEGRIKKGKTSGTPAASPLEPTVEPLLDSFEDDSDEVLGDDFNEGR
jgi:hypothetical protein